MTRCITERHENRTAASPLIIRSTHRLSDFVTDHSLHETTTPCVDDKGDANIAFLLPFVTLSLELNSHEKNSIQDFDHNVPYWTVHGYWNQL